MSAADKIAEAPLPKAEKLARAMDGVMSGGRSFNRQLAAQIRNELRASQALADALAQENARLRGCFERIEKAALHGCLTPELVAQITRAALGETP